MTDINISAFDNFDEVWARVTGKDEQPIPYPLCSNPINSSSGPKMIFGHKSRCIRFIPEI